MDQGREQTGPLSTCMSLLGVGRWSVGKREGGRGGRDGGREVDS